MLVSSESSSGDSSKMSSGGSQRDSSGNFSRASDSSDTYLLKSLEASVRDSAKVLIGS